MHFRLIEKSRIRKKRIIFSFTLKSKNINFSLFIPYYLEKGSSGTCNILFYKQQ